MFYVYEFVFGRDEMPKFFKQVASYDLLVCAKEKWFALDIQEHQGSCICYIDESDFVVHEVMLDENDVDKLSFEEISDLIKMALVFQIEILGII